MKKKKLTKKPEAPKNISRLEDEVAKFNPEFVEWLRSRKPRKAGG